MPPVFELGDYESRSITAENPTGRRGAGGQARTGSGDRAAAALGVGWKVSPAVIVPAGESVEIADIEGPGLLTHLWMAVHPDWNRRLVLQIHWDDAEFASINVPLGDFFCSAWPEFAAVNSRFVVTAPLGGLNSYWPMPFAGRARISVTNLWQADVSLFYQVDYRLQDVPAPSYLHACWRRSNPVRDGLHELLELAADGQYVGTYLAFGSTSPGWWGEGEFKFYLDGEDFPTIVATGTEDYFGGAWNFDVPGAGYTSFSTAYLGLPQVSRPDGLYRSQTRFGMYRWHEPDPIRFRQRLRVTVQDLGWFPDGTYQRRSDDIATLALSYTARPAPGNDEAYDRNQLATSSLP